MPYANPEKAKAKMQERYRARAEAGVCTRCGDAPPVGGETQCAGCKARENARHRASYPDKYKKHGKRMREAERARIRERREAGICTRCGVRPPESPGYARCNECRAHMQDLLHRSRAARPDWRRAQTLRAYGLTMSQFDAMLASQGGRCAICQKDAPDSKGWQVDHNHATGEVRGILCRPCNVALGHFEDDPVTLQRAARYLVIRGGATTERQAPLIRSDHAS